MCRGAVRLRPAGQVTDARGCSGRSGQKNGGGRDQGQSGTLVAKREWEFGVRKKKVANRGVRNVGMFESRVVGCPEDRAPHARAWCVRISGRGNACCPGVGASCCRGVRTSGHRNARGRVSGYPGAETHVVRVSVRCVAEGRTSGLRNVKVWGVGISGVSGRGNACCEGVGVSCCRGIRTSGHRNTRVRGGWDYRTPK